jgi:hypothetical protein
MSQLSTQPYNVSRPRMILATSLILSLITIHLYEIIASTEHWPFSSYPMYSELHDSDTFTTLNLIGIRASDNKPIPLNSTWQRKTFTRLARRDDAPQKLHSALKKFFDAYQKEAKKNHKPPLKSLRLYQEKARLTETGKREILESKLLAQYTKSKPRSIPNPSRPSTKSVGATLVSPSSPFPFFAPVSRYLELGASVFGA